MPPGKEPWSGRLRVMAIDFTFARDVEEVRQRMRAFMDDEVRPTETRLTSEAAGRGEWRVALDEGNMHTLLHFGTDEQKATYLRPMCEGRLRSCFAMTEPDVAGSDPTLMQTRGVLAGDTWTIDGHKWFISGARGAAFAILIARTENDPEVPQAATTACIVDLPDPGFEIVRDIETMSGSHNHCEIRIHGLHVPVTRVLGERGGGHRLGQSRLGPARLAHCMRWLGQIETALDLMVARSLDRFSHGSLEPVRRRGRRDPQVEGRRGVHRRLPSIGEHSCCNGKPPVVTGVRVLSGTRSAGTPGSRGARAGPPARSRRPAGARRSSRWHGHQPGAPARRR